MANWFDVEPNKSLLDNSFDGYKLSLDKLPCYERELVTSSSSTGDSSSASSSSGGAVHVVNLPTHEYSLQHVKLYSSHNHLTPDPWNCHTVYFIGKNLDIVAIGGTRASGLTEPFSVHRGSGNMNVPDQLDRYNATLSFPAPNMAVCSDGLGSLLLLDTGSRSERHQWTVITTVKLSRSVVIVDSLLSNDSRPTLSLVTAHVEEIGNSVAKFKTVISWIRYMLDGNGDWQENSIKVYHTADVEFVCLDESGFLHLASKCHEFENSTPQEGQDNSQPQPKDLPKTKYTWLQADEDITAQLAVPDGTQKDSIVVNFSRSALKVVVNGQVLLYGQLQRPVRVDECTWTVNNSRLEVFITKQDSDWWNEFIVGDETGEMVCDAETAERIHENLKYWISESTPMEETEEKMDTLNTQDLEACDFRVDDATFLCRLTWESYQPTHIASKEKRRFLTCSPSCSYAVLADTERQIYIYRQPSEVSGELRNRNTGRAVPCVSKQHLVTLNNNDSIRGMVATDEVVFVLTASTLYMIGV